MSGFLNKLLLSIEACDVADWDGNSMNEEQVDSAYGLVESLGENARRMLEIGEVMDELVKLGCQLVNHSGDENDPFFAINYIVVYKYYEIVFWQQFAWFNVGGDRKYYYNSKEDMQDLLNKARELING